MVIDTLSHYRILEKLGAGGMGEVYRAEDTVLGREVALKLLPEEFTADVERLARFEREAMILASLNHPHIAQIYSFERIDDQQFLVLELVEGDTLAERLDRGPIPRQEALTVALQIAHALEAAHDNGIVHRDLKPANVKITPQGQVKVLDFGISKPAMPTTAAELTHAPTVPYPDTREGVVFGTPAYMSPEQARGQEVGKRSDIWAFGVVLWEMLTGERLFKGPTDSDSLAAVLQTDPDWDALPTDTPSPIHRTLHRCLVRDLDSRLHDIADARLEVEEALAVSDNADAPAADLVEPTHRSRWRSVAWLALATLVVGVVLSTAVFWKRGTSENPDRLSRRWSIAPPPRVTLTGASHRGPLAASPDGRWLVFVGSEGETSRLYKRAVNEFEVTAIPDTEDAKSPFFSPDSHWLGFWKSTEGKLMRVPIQGGTPVEICEALSLWGASWGPDDSIVFVPYDTQGIWRVPAVGGEPEMLLHPSPELGAHDLSWPRYLPDGEAVLFTAWRGYTPVSSFVGVLDLETGKADVLIDNGSSAQYLPTGHLLYGRGERLEVVPFSAARREVTGPSVPVTESILYDRLGGTASLTTSTAAGGTLYFLPGVGALELQLASIDLQGVETPIHDSLHDYYYPRYSPEGERLAVSIFDSEGPDIWVIHLGTGVETRITSGGGHLYGLWTRDGARLVFPKETTNPPTSTGIYWKRVDGSAPEEPLLLAEEAGEFLEPFSITADGRFLAFGRTRLFSEQRNMEVWLLDLASGEQQLLISDPKAPVTGAVFSPDGRWLAFHSHASGRTEVYVQAISPGDERHQISNKGGGTPLWSPDGRTLYYYRQEREFMAVDLSTTPDFYAGVPQLLFERTLFGSIYDFIPRFDLAPDGERFVAVREGPTKRTPNEIRVVENWFDEVRRLAPSETP